MSAGKALAKMMTKKKPSTGKLLAMKARKMPKGPKGKNLALEADDFPKSLSKGEAGSLLGKKVASAAFLKGFNKEAAKNG